MSRQTRASKIDSNSLDVKPEESQKNDNDNRCVIQNFTMG